MVNEGQVKKQGHIKFRERVKSLSRVITKKGEGQVNKQGHIKSRKRVKSISRVTSKVGTFYQRPSTG